MSDQCKWSETEDGFWICCNHAYEFNAGTPSENGFKFCPYCGKELEEVRWEEKN